MQIDAILVNNRRFSIGRSALVASSRRRFRCPCDRTPNHQPAVRKKTLVREVFLHQVTVLARWKRVCSGVPARVVPTIDADLRRGPAESAECGSRPATTRTQGLSLRSALGTVPASSSSATVRRRREQTTPPRHAARARAGQFSPLAGGIEPQCGCISSNCT